MILIADDHPLLLLGLKSFLIKKGYQNIVTADDGQAAYNIIIKHKPKIAILDIRMPVMSGLEVATLCQKNCIDIDIILITLYKDEILYQKARDLGVKGYLFKQFALEEISTCLNEISKGNSYWSSEIKSMISISSVDDVVHLLTPSELKILKLIAQGETTPKIANMLFISAKTVEKHRSNIVKKLQLEGKTNSLLLWAKTNADKLQ